MNTANVAIKLGAPPEVADALAKCCTHYGISSLLEKGHFLGQMAQESQNYTKVVENMRYSAKRMAEVWPGRYATEVSKRLPTKQRMPNPKAIALAQAGEQAIANDVYGGRMGNIKPGDGWNFRGQGFKMITGRDNVTAYSYATYGDDRVVKDPSMLQRLPDSVFSGGWYWKKNKIGPYANKNDGLAVGRLINIGTLDTNLIPIGNSQRLAKTELAIKFFQEFDR